MNWKAFIIVLLIPSLVHAQASVTPYLPPVPELKLEPIPPGEDNIVPLPKGAAAPFSGQLFDSATALRWGNYLEQYKLRLGLCYQQQQDLARLHQTYFDEVMKIEKESKGTIVADLEGRLRKMEDKNAELEVEAGQGPAWYNSLEFGVVLGVVGTVALVGLGAWAFDSVRR